MVKGKQKQEKRQEENENELLLPVGIDLGSYYARIAIIPNISSLLNQQEEQEQKDEEENEKNGNKIIIAPNILANPHTGSRYTLALSTIEDNNDTNENGSNNNINKLDTTTSNKNHIFGDIAYRHLSRKCDNLNDIHNKLFVRSLSSCSSSNSSSENGHDKKTDSTESNGIKNNNDNGNSESDIDNSSSIAFFEYLCDIAYQAYNNNSSDNNISLSATSLRIVLSLPSTIPLKERIHIQSICNEGIISYIQKKEGKRKRKEYCKKINNNFVISTICDSSSVCIAHDLTSCANSPNKWKYAWVVNFGNSGFLITMYKNHHGILERLGPINNTNNQQQQYNPNLSTKYIQILIQQFIIQQFIQKNRLSLSISTKILSNNKTMYKLHMAIEDTLRTFIRMNTVNIHIDSFYDGIDLNISMSRPRLDMLLSQVFKYVQYMFTNNQTLFTEKYGSNNANIDVVLVSGSGFQMPNINKMLESSFPNSRIIMDASSGSNDSNSNNIPCDEVVAIGCAKYAYQILYHDYFTKNEENKYIKNNNEEHSNALCSSSMNVPICPFSIAIAYCNDNSKNGAFTLENDDGTINDSWTIVSFMDNDHDNSNSTMLPYASTKSISFSNNIENDDEIPCSYYIIQQNITSNNDTTTTTSHYNPLAKIAVDKKDITKDQNNMLHLSLNIDKDYKIQFILKNTGECVSL